MDKRTSNAAMRRIASLLLAFAMLPLLAAPAGAAGWQEEDRGEIEQGREADKQIEAQYGFYQDEELNAYVTAIGERMAALSERPTLPWTFRVLDSPVVNAFALPGGFVYVTRGLLAYAGSEAELAGVIGHEIGHVTGRHSRSRQRSSLFANLAILAGALLSDTVRDLVELGVPQLAAGLALTKYSRDQELDADHRGIGYATQAGYNPYGIGGFFETLQSLEAQSDSRRLPGWVSTHPQVDDRIERSNRWAAEALARWNLDADELYVGRPELLAQVDGIVFGENPREGYMRDNDFVHPDLRFRIAFPGDWSVRNARAAVTVVAPAERAYLKLELAAPQEEQTMRDYVRAYLRELRADVLDSGSIEVNGLEAYEASFTVTDGNTQYAVLGNWIQWDGRLYQLLGITTPSRWRDYASTMERSMHSFAELTDEEVLGIQPARLAVTEVEQSMQLAGVIEQHADLSVSPQTVEILNHRSLQDLIGAGDLVKLVFGGPGAGR
jgi:predicted Zn-dependent protease